MTLSTPDVAAVESPPQTPPAGTPAPEPVERLLPRWFAAPLAGAVVWCATAGSIGMVLLYADSYAPGPVIGGATAAALAVGAGCAFAARGRADRATHVAAAGAVVLALALGALAGAFHSEHLLVDRDPAVYVNTGRSIARTHELNPVVVSGEFADANRYSGSSPSVGVARTRARPGFFHMLPVLLAVGWSIGGDQGLLVVPAFLGALGVLALFALASHVVGARAALLACAVFTLAPLQLWFAVTPTRSCSCRYWFSVGSG